MHLPQAVIYLYFIGKPLPSLRNLKKKKEKGTTVHCLSLSKVTRQKERSKAF